MSLTSLYCTECGSVLNKNKTCSNANCKNHTTQASTDSNNLNFSLFEKRKRIFSEKGKQIVPECIQSDRDEVPVRQYDIARLQSFIIGAFAEGRLQVTNKRVLFRSSGCSLVGKTYLQYEFSLEEVSGIELRKEARFHITTFIFLALISSIASLIFNPLFTPIYSSRVLGFLLTILMPVGAVLTFLLLKHRKMLAHIILSVCSIGTCADLGMWQLLTGQNGFLQTIAGIIVLALFALNMILLVFSPNLVILMKTKGGAPSIEIRRKDGWFSLNRNEYTGFSQVLPGPDVDIAMKEIGAIIRQIQQTGTYKTE